MGKRQSISDEPATLSENHGPLITFAEYAAGSSQSPVLLAGARLALQQDGQSRKRTQQDWAKAVEIFATAPSL